MTNRKIEKENVVHTKKEFYLVVKKYLEIRS